MMSEAGPRRFLCTGPDYHEFEEGETSQAVEQPEPEPPGFFKRAFQKLFQTQ